MIRLCLLLSTLIASTKVWAEYRAFQLEIDGGASRDVISILDQYQYPVYHPLNKGETIKYVDSWMCYENMSQFQKPCAKPDRKPAVATPPPKTGKPN
jgi:hypothetical protein